MGVELPFCIVAILIVMKMHVYTSKMICLGKNLSKP